MFPTWQACEQAVQLPLGGRCPREVQGGGQPLDDSSQGLVTEAGAAADVHVAPQALVKAPAAGKTQEVKGIQTGNLVLNQSLSPLSY